MTESSEFSVMRRNPPRKSRRTLTGSAAELGDVRPNITGGTVGHTDWLRDSSVGIRRLAHPHHSVSSSRVETLTPLNAAGGVIAMRERRM